MNKKIKQLIKNRRKVNLITILCLILIYTTSHALITNSAQNPLIPQLPPLPAPKTDVTKKVVELKKAGLMEKQPWFSGNILRNEVELYHDGAYMFCDSAYIYEETNSFDAFGVVEVRQGDTLFMHSSFLHYDGNTKLLQVRNNVRLEHIDKKKNKMVTLFTDSLDYDRNRNIGYYFDGGMLVDAIDNDQENILTSYWGQYDTNSRIAIFKDSVKMTNPKFVMYTDELEYNTNTKVADIKSPTRIEADSANIYTTRGWYNTNTEESLLLDQSRIVNKEGNRTLTGDSIFYDKKAGFGEVFGNMFLQDTLKKVILQGNYGFYDELKEYAFATDSAFATEYSQPDSLYIHADTLKMVTDSIFKEIKGYYGVRIYRADIQGVCDSIQFNSKDSTLFMYKDPVLWNAKNQIKGDTIQIFFNDSTIEMAHFKRYAFAIEDKDSIHYNQLKGRSLKAFFDNGQIRNVLVEGDAESIFYPEEKDLTLIGANKSTSTYLSIDFKDKKFERLKIWGGTPKAQMTPIPDLKPGDGRLNDFEWLDYLRPINKMDIFRKEKRNKDGEAPKRSNKFKYD